MKKKPVYLFIVVGALSLMLSGCADDSSTTTSRLTYSLSGSGTYSHVDFDGGEGILQYTLSLGSTPQDVYFIFTNTNASDVTTATTVSSSASGAETDVSESFLIHQNEPDDPLQWAREHGIGLRGKPEITAFNSHPPVMTTNDADGIYKNTVPKPLFASVGATNTFMYESTTANTIPATLQAVVSDGTITLNLWVANDAWAPCSKSYCMNLTMVNAFANKFLQSGSNNDIYDWVTNIFGVPWGSRSFTNLIDASAASSIDILFYDIDSDNSTTGGTLAFFYAKDNFQASSISYSNERLMFYMDSVLAATKEGSSWDISDQWPADMVSTLAHEFQHMIHYYQKQIKHEYQSSSDTWINEMASMVTEDLLADKLLVNGPRGVDYTDNTAGSSGNSSGGRLPWFNLRDYYSPTTWGSYPYSLPNYGINYAFGAYLARNFGGAALFQKIVQNQYRDYQAVVSAVTEMGYSGETFTSLLQKWGVAVLLSDQTSTASGYQYNTGSGFASSVNSISYNVGSVNLFNYYQYGGTNSGPRIFSVSDLAALGGHYKLSNTYVRVGQNQTGSFTATMDSTSGVKLTVVTKNSN